MKYDDTYMPMSKCSFSYKGVKVYPLYESVMNKLNTDTKLVCCGYHLNNNIPSNLGKDEIKQSINDLLKQGLTAEELNTYHDGIRKWNCLLRRENK